MSIDPSALWDAIESGKDPQQPDYSGSYVRSPKTQHGTRPEEITREEKGGISSGQRKTARKAAGSSPSDKIIVSISVPHELYLLAGIRKTPLSTLLKSIIGDYMSSRGKKEIQEYIKSL